MNEFTILSYHEISNKNEALDLTYTVTPLHFKEQVDWLISHDYHFISLDDIIEHRKKGTALPNKSILLTFDDGYQSFYTNAYPIIKKYKIPVVIALVGSWLQAKDQVDYSGKIVTRNKFLSPKEIKEMIGSGLVEIANHSYSLHKGIPGNPQADVEPAATTRQWLTDKKMYEDDADYHRRVYNDLLKNSRVLEKYSGKKPRAIVWPYGHYNIEARKIAEKLGMPIGLSLEDGSNTRITPLWGLRRALIENQTTINDLKKEMELRQANLTDDDRSTKAAHIDLDYIYDADINQQKRNINDLLVRLKKLNVNTVFLQAFSDLDANGAADSVYFPNRNVPMRADLFNHVAWTISNNTPVKRVYAWMPMLAWELPQKNVAAKETVVTLQVDPNHLNMGYPRLSPFSDKARNVIKQIYKDLAKSAYIDGILFHDDVTLSDFEDDSAFAQKQYHQWGLSKNVTEIRMDKAQFQKWTKLKTRFLDELAMQLTKIVRNEQPGLKSARNLYAQVALNNNAEEWYAQSLSQSIKHYDYTAIMAMPYMEGVNDAKQFYDAIIKQVKKQPCGLDRTIMELQTVNWKKNNEPISSQKLNNTIEHFYLLGVHHVAYYPDNLYINNPNADMIKQTFNKKSSRIHL